MVRLLITSPMFEFVRAACSHEDIELIDGRKLSEAELVALAPSIDGWLVGTEAISARVFEAASALKVLGRTGAGYDNVDLEQATARGIVVTVAAGANAESVADLTFGLMLAIARRVPHIHQLVAQGSWQRHIGTELWRKRLGIVGLGSIGRAVARRATGFEMDVVVATRTRDEQLAERYGLRYVDLDELVQTSDFVSLHAALTPETRNMIDARRLGLMRPSAFLINTARGDLVNEPALVEALREGRIAGAALDVFAIEPPAGSPLLELDNVVLSAHTAASTHESFGRSAALALESALSVLAGGRPPTVVNPQVWQAQSGATPRADRA